MTILSINVDTVGQSGIEPKFIYINTNNTVAEVTAAGFLNGMVREGIPISETDMALVVTRATPNAKAAQVSLFDVSFANGDWSLTANSTPLTLANGQIFVGNAGGIATGVTMSGDATISNTGVITLANGAVALANLDAGITPSHVVKYAGASVEAGGSATVTITVTGVLGTDLPFCQIGASANAVEVQKVTATTNTVTVLCSGDPGASTFNYQVLRAAV
jgi:hypothetical protein